jgi:hypothetical protein
MDDSRLRKKLTKRYSWPIEPGLIGEIPEGISRSRFTCCGGMAPRRRAAELKLRISYIRVLTSSIIS